MTRRTLEFSAEELGVIVDALIAHRTHAHGRKSANSESTSDVRSEMCADLIRRINGYAMDAALDGRHGGS